MNSDLLKVRIHIGASPDIDIYRDNITIESVRMTIYRWVIFQIEDLSVLDLEDILKFAYSIVIHEGIDISQNFRNQEVTIEWIFSDNDKSVSLDSMDEKKTKGLTDKELIEKYGDKKAPGFNEALRNTTKTRKRITEHTQSPLKPTKKK